ncbi:MAG: hypothetical protein JST49_11030 [Bacteroidetes bacterium]|nr:hypothetical protein [Bacteroidota bacterium]
MEIKNWKLVEVIDKLEVLSYDSLSYRDELLKKLDIPLSNSLTGMNRAETTIDWTKMPNYYKSFFDYVGWEEKVSSWFLQSQLGKVQNLVIPYYAGGNGPTVKIPTEIFISDWEGFMRSAFWETIIFSEDNSLIMEITRDYHVHSNFKIVP